MEPISKFKMKVVYISHASSTKSLKVVLHNMLSNLVHDVGCCTSSIVLALGKVWV